MSVKIIERLLIFVVGLYVYYGGTNGGKPFRSMKATKGRFTFRYFICIFIVLLIFSAEIIVNYEEVLPSILKQADHVRSYLASCKYS